MTANSLVRTDFPPTPGLRPGAPFSGFERRDYQHAANVLDQARDALELIDAAATLPLVNAAKRICLACKQARDEAEWHGKALAEVTEREQTLERELDALLELIDTAQSTAPIEDVTGSVPIPIGATERATGGNRPSHHAGELRERIRDALDSLRRRATDVCSDPDSVVKPLALYRGDGPRAETSPSSATQSKNPESVSHRDDAPPSIAVCCLGSFQVYLNDRLVSELRNGKAKAVLKYLLVHHDRPIHKDVLMDLFWPDADAERARNNLNVTIHHIRRTLSEPQGYAHILFDDDCYRLNPELHVWIDAESFSTHFNLGHALERHGDHDAAIREYCAADALYGGQFLEEDRYEDWARPKRRALEEDYLTLLDRLAGYSFERGDYDRCLAVCHKILSVDACRESAHRRMMRCFAHREEPYLAMRQFHRCARALDVELATAPSRATVELVQRIRNRVRV